ncbi:hypothetical protein ACFPZI_00505 [Streptomyces chlorus]|uniref:MFS transporter n=1 Tax=Streptomyces chlorus TaxID=887452 RepID=A0ABW1DRS3_9ACTN
MSNPKGLLSSVLPRSVNPSTGNVQVQLLLLGLIRVLIALVSDATWGLLAGTARNWLAGKPRGLSLIGGAPGMVMAGPGARPGFSGRE